MPKMHIAWIPIRNLPSHGFFFLFGYWLLVVAVAVAVTVSMLPDFIFGFGHNLRDHGASITRNYRGACAVRADVAVAVAIDVAVGALGF